MTSRKRNRITLSDSILDMKFMRRVKEKIDNEIYEKEGEEYFRSSTTEKMNKSERFIIMEPSYVFCENLIDGRLSYNGMNTKIEKLMEEENQNRMKPEVKDPTDVSDEQMTEHWKQMEHDKSNRYKFNTSPQDTNAEDEIPAKRPRFLKPVD